MATEFKLPELGENIEEADVVQVLVEVGDEIEEDQPVLEIETDKAAFEVPSSVSGKVTEIHVEAGDKAEVGQVILTLDAEEEAPEAEEEEPEEEQAEEGEEPSEQEAAQEEEEPEAKETEEEEDQEEVEEKPAEGSRELVPAAPSTRRFAREIGVDIAEVSGSGPGGRISIEDVKSHARKSRAAGKQEADKEPTPAAGIPRPSLPDFSKWGEISRESMSNVRRRTAEHLGEAWVNIPHVTQFDKADITELEKLRKQHASRAEEAGGKLTVTAITIKAAVAALKAFPKFNASIDMENHEVIYKKYYHIGVAVDTERGLLVPVIRDVDQKSIVQVAVELGEVAQKARDRKITPEDLQGATFTVTNLGGIGGTNFTPVVNSPEVAILGVARSRMEPVFIDEEFKPRLMMPMALSYDHRLIDGADAARFMRWLVEILEEPFLMTLEA